MAQGRDLHQKAEMARELEQDFVKALQLTDEATVAYADEEDSRGLAEVTASRQNTFGHLYQKTGNKNFLTLAKYTAQAAVEIAENSSIPEALALPYRDLAKVYEDLKDYSKAATFHQKAVEAMRSHPPKEHARPAVLADMEAHLAYAQYKAGDKNAYIRLKSAIADLEKAGETPYNKDVWLSGAHMRAAQMLREGSPDDAKIHLQRAKEIIDNNKELTLRAEQWEKLAALFTDRVS